MQVFLLPRPMHRLTCRPPPSSFHAVVDHRTNSSTYHANAGACRKYSLEDSSTRCFVGGSIHPSRNGTCCVNQAKQENNGICFIQMFYGFLSLSYFSLKTKTGTVRSGLPCGARGCLCGSHERTGRVGTCR